MGGGNLMKKIIYRKSDLICVGTIQDNTNFEWEIENNVIPNFGGVADDYEEIEVNCNRFKLEQQGDIIISVEVGLTTNEQKNIILNQLAQLDIIVPRIVEDIIEQGNFTIHQSKIDIITQKQTLRQQLQDLEV
jgi:hypothetical protein